MSRELRALGYRKLSVRPRHYAQDRDAMAAHIILSQAVPFTKTIRREMKRRAAVEPVIGHVKAEHRMDRNYLKGCVAGAEGRTAIASTPSWPPPVTTSTSSSDGPSHSRNLNHEGQPWPLPLRRLVGDRKTTARSPCPEVSTTGTSGTYSPPPDSTSMTSDCEVGVF